MWIRFYFVVLGWVGSLTAPEAADWPQWRGPNRDGHATSGTSLHQLPAEPAVVWRAKAGAGLASPIVAGTHVVHFDAVDGRETIHAVERSSGQELWRRAIDDTFHDTQGPDGPRCTPMIDGDRVYAVSCRGRLVCLNLKDGQERWAVNYADFGAQFIGEKGNVPGAGRHGNNGTPLIAGGRLYACAGGAEGAGVVCLDKITGQLIWKSQNDLAGYAAPVMARLTGLDQLICFTAEALIGLDPKNGELFWRRPIKTAFGRHATAPVWHENVVVVSSHQAGMIGLRIKREENTVQAEDAWLSKESAMNFASGVAAGKHLYGLGPRKNLVCIDILTGQPAWSREGYFQTSADKSYAGFIVVGQNILCLTDGGLLVLFKATPEKFEELGQTQVCGANWCNPAYADGRLYLRDGNKGAGTGEWLCLDLTRSQEGPKAEATPPQ